MRYVCVRADPPSGYKQWSYRRVWRYIRPSSGTSCRTPPSTTVWGCRGGRTGPLGTWTIASLRWRAKGQGGRSVSMETTQPATFLHSPKSGPARHLCSFFYCCGSQNIRRQSVVELTLADVSSSRANWTAFAAKYICRMTVCQRGWWSTNQQRQSQTKLFQYLAGGWQKFRSLIIVVWCILKGSTLTGNES